MHLLPALVRSLLLHLTCLVSVNNAFLLHSTTPPSAKSFRLYTSSSSSSSSGSSSSSSAINSATNHAKLASRAQQLIADVGYFIADLHLDYHKFSTILQNANTAIPTALLNAPNSFQAPAVDEQQQQQPLTTTTTTLSSIQNHTWTVSTHPILSPMFHSPTILATLQTLHKAHLLSQNQIPNASFRTNFPSWLDYGPNLKWVYGAHAARSIVQKIACSSHPSSKLHEVITIMLVYRVELKRDIMIVQSMKEVLTAMTLACEAFPKTTLQTTTSTTKSNNGGEEMMMMKMKVDLLENFVRNFVKNVEGITLEEASKGVERLDRNRDAYTVEDH